MREPARDSPDELHLESESDLLADGKEGRKASDGNDGRNHEEVSSGDTALPGDGTIASASGT